MKKHRQQSLRSKKRRGRAHLDAVNAARRARGAPLPPAEAERFNDWRAGTVDVLAVERDEAAPRVPLESDSGFVERDGNKIVAYFNDHDSPTRKEFATHARVWYPDGRMQILWLNPPDLNDAAPTATRVLLPDDQATNTNEA